MPIIYRTDKGGPLILEEMDGNFKTLADQLHALQHQPLLGEKWEKVICKGRDLYFYTDQGQVMGPVEIPLLTWRPCGQWRTQESYAPYDVVQYNMGLYVCQEGYDSSDFSQQEKCWQLLLRLPDLKAETKPSTLKLPAYYSQDLPATAELGTLALQIHDSAHKEVVYYDGARWMTLMAQPQA